MKKIIALLIVTQIIVCNLFSQTFSSPFVEKRMAKDVFIKSVVISENYTQVNFICKNTEDKGHYIYLNSPGHKDALFIKANGIVYKLLSTRNIANINGLTAAMPDKVIEFSARFEKIPSNVSQFDLVEGESGSWDFWGVHLTNSSNTAEDNKFRIDYSFVAYYNMKTDKWSDWIASENTFVVNINKQGDITRLKENGEIVIYKRLSKKIEEDVTKNGEHYQLIKALDEDGDIFSFQIFDDSAVGLKMIYGNLIIQFSKTKNK